MYAFIYWFICYSVASMRDFLRCTGVCARSVCTLVTLDARATDNSTDVRTRRARSTTPMRDDGARDDDDDDDATARADDAVTATTTTPSRESSSDGRTTANVEGGRATSEGATARALMLASTNSFRAPRAGTKAALEVHVSTWNVGNKAPRADAASGWLRDARRSDIVAVGAQEASYVKTRKTIKPVAVSAACGDEANFKSRFRKGFFKSTKWTRVGMVAGGAFAGGVMAAPVAPMGVMCGMFTGWFASKRLVQEIKVRIHWFDFLHSALGHEFELLQTQILLQMRLAVFVKKELVPRIRSVKVGRKATGLGNLVGNKGGLLVHIELENGETIAFLSCHLAAHEQPKYLEARNHMVHEILEGTWIDCVEKPKCALPVVTDVNSALFDAGSEMINKMKGTSRQVYERTSDAFQGATGARLAIGSGMAPRKNQAPELLDVATHVFFFGDLNYRLDPGKVVGNEWDTHWDKTAPEMTSTKLANKYDVDKVPLSKFPAARPVAQPGMIEEESDDEITESSPFQIGRTAVIESVGAQEFDQLVKADQLIKSMKEGKVFANFHEMPLKFFPTFKRASNNLKDGKGKKAPAQEQSVAEPGSAEYYNEKRVPSWCDRVLVHSLTGAKDSCSPLEYGARHDVTTSDHAPVYARFRVRLRDLPPLKALPRAKLTLTNLSVTRNTIEDDFLGSSVYVHLFVPHTRTVVPEAREVSSGHVARDESQPKTIGKYTFSGDVLPSCIVGYDAADEVTFAEQEKAAARFALLTTEERIALKENEDAEKSEELPTPVGMDAYGKFVGIITLVDSRYGDKLGTCTVLLPSKGSSSFDVPLLLRSANVGRIKGSWELSSI